MLLYLLRLWLLLVVVNIQRMHNPSIRIDMMCRKTCSS